MRQTNKQTSGKKFLKVSTQQQQQRQQLPAAAIIYYT